MKEVPIASEIEDGFSPVVTRPTLRDVAREAGVSVPTASRVVNNETNVVAATAQRVNAAVRRLGYRPNDIARSLRGHRSRTIGLVIADVSNPFYAECAKAVEGVARERGYALILCASDECLDIEQRHVDLLVRRRIDGLILVPTTGDHTYLEAHSQELLPLVALDRPLDREGTDSVLVRNREGAEVATTHLIEHGHQRIAYVGAEADLFTTQERLKGYERAMKLGGLSPSYRVGVPSIVSARQVAKELLRSPDRPTGIFAMNNLITVGILQALQDLNMHVPHDVALVGFDDFELAGLLYPRLTLVRQPAALLGRRATELLFERLDGKRIGAGHRSVLDTDLIIRESCGCRSMRGALDDGP